MPEHYYELVVKVSSHHILFSDFLSDTLPVGFEEIKDGFIIRSEDDLKTMIWGIEQFSEALQKALSLSIEVECTQSKLKNSNWVKEYQKSIEPLKINGFYIHPTWDKPNSDLINIAINPALAFGTGHHPTTASAIRAIFDYVKKDDEVLDVGCGSGILGIAAMKLGAKVDACDTDKISVDNAIENAKLNNLIFSKIWEGSSSLVDKKYDIVLANIVADVLIFIANDLKKALKDDAILVLSGILDKYENRVLSSYEDCKLMQKISQDEWVTLILRNKK